MIQSFDEFKPLIESNGKPLSSKQIVKIKKAIKLLEEANSIVEQLDSEINFFNDMSGAATVKRRLADLL